MSCHMAALTESPRVGRLYRRDRAEASKSSAGNSRAGVMRRIGAVHNGMKKLDGAFTGLNRPGEEVFRVKASESLSQIRAQTVRHFLIKGVIDSEHGWPLSIRVQVSTIILRVAVTIRWSS